MLWVFNIYSTVFDYIVNSKSLIVQLSALTAFALMIGASYGICVDAFNIFTRFLATFLDFVSVFVRGINFTHGLANGTKFNEFISILVQAFHERDPVKQSQLFSNATNVPAPYNASAQRTSFYVNSFFSGDKDRS